MKPLPDRLLAAIGAQDFATARAAGPDGGAAEPFPSLDLAVVRFDPSPAGHLPDAANVLFSREHLRGVVAAFAPDFGAVDNVRFDADLRDADGRSVAWLPDADWAQLPWRPLHGAANLPRVVAPYPASLLKLMVAVGVARAVDAGSCDWPDALAPMLTVSDNDATDACVALLHRVGQLTTAADGNPLNALFAAHGLPTLRLDATTPAGGWRNADGAGVGRIHMTAWDTVRLLWLLDADAPPPPWLPAGQAPLLSPASRDRLRALLAAQQLDEVLSSGTLRGVPGWVEGLPDAPAFAHKTGTTDNYASDAGIVRADGVHYIVALLSSLGRRHAPDPRCATTWALPALGAAVHAAVRDAAGGAAMRDAAGGAAMRDAAGGAAVRDAPGAAPVAAATAARCDGTASGGPPR